MFEEVGVFSRGVGESTDVVRKEMYEFEDRGGRHLALRPEGTASVVRAFVQLRPPTPFKAWYAAPSFRYERPQAGRFRQHHQLGVEVLGSDDADVDVEVIALQAGFYQDVGLSRFSLAVNSLGCRECKPAYLEALRVFLLGRAEHLCDEHRERFQINPLRVLDCKKEPCRVATADAPQGIDFLCEACATHFHRVNSGLDAVGVSYSLDPRLVRGLDYYTRTTFEFASTALDSAQNAIGGGGRYDGLAEALGGPPTPGIGFGSGIERVLIAAQSEGLLEGEPATCDVWVIDVTGGQQARDLTHELRSAGISADRGFDQRSMKAQFRAAGKAGARFAVVVGEEELASATVTLKELDGGVGQVSVARSQIVTELRAKL